MIGSISGVVFFTQQASEYEVFLDLIDWVFMFCAH
jgi:hypothetical protein